METETVTELLQRVAREVVTPRFRSLAEGQVREKGPGDLVTVADTEAEAFLTEALQAVHPEALVLGEEAVAESPDRLAALAEADHAWVIDPIDGTRNFVRGSPDHAVMVAELRAGEAVRAWIHQPQHATTWTAELGGGVRHDGVRVQRQSPGEDPAGWAGVSSRNRWRERQYPPLGPIGSSAWCCGVDYPRLLAGACDFIVYASPKPWDHLPGTLMLRELGGEAVLLDDGRPYRATSTGSPLLVGASVDLVEGVRAALTGV